MNSRTAQLSASTWLMENGPKVLESLLRVTIFRPFGAIPHTDGHRTDTDSSGGAGKHRVPHALGQILFICWIRRELQRILVIR